MSLEAGSALTYGLVRFYSLDTMRRYIKGLMESYEREVDQLSNFVGTLLRAPDDGRNTAVSKAWYKMGVLYVNSTDSTRGTVEVIFQVLTEMRPKIARLRDALQSFESMETLDVPEGASILLYLKQGVPERIIVDSEEARPEVFAYSATMKTV